jgi:hypothetical protein
MTEHPPSHGIPHSGNPFNRPLLRVEDSRDKEEGQGSPSTGYRDRGGNHVMIKLGC